MEMEMRKRGRHCSFRFRGHFKCGEDKDESWTALDILFQANRILIEGLGRDDKQEKFVR